MIDDGFGDFVEEEVGVVGDDADDFEFGFFADAAADGVGGFEEDCGEFLVDEDAVLSPVGAKSRPAVMGILRASKKPAEMEYWAMNWGLMPRSVDQPPRVRGTEFDTAVPGV